MERLPLDSFKEEADLLQKAKIILMTDPNTVFYTTILFSLKQYFSTDIPAAATDGTELILNPHFFRELEPKERIGLLLHEIMHVALDHMSRCGNRDKEIWNIAGDHVINLSLHKSAYSLPPDGLLDFDYDGMSTEEVYNCIKDRIKKDGNFIANNGVNNKLAGDVIPISAAGSEEEQESKANEITEIVLRAAIQGDVNASPGSVPAEIMIALNNKINPKLPWNEILMNFLTEFAKDDYSFQRPNKRFLPNNYLPIARSEAITNIAVAVDSSCSVSDSEFSYFIAEIDRIQQELQPSKITVITFDTMIKKVQTLTPDKDIFKELKFIGRGGTQIKPVLKWAEKNEPAVLIIFSDGEFSIPKMKITVPIIWVIHDDDTWTAPFGQVVNYDMEDY
jgi:predicted metal-dependent peptidase